MHVLPWVQDAGERPVRGVRGQLVLLQQRAVPLPMAIDLTTGLQHPGRVPVPARILRVVLRLRQVHPRIVLHWGLSDGDTGHRHVSGGKTLP